jgi:hypothetical protein
MPNIIEISGLLSGKGRKCKMGRLAAKKKRGRRIPKVKTSGQKKKKKLPGPSAERALEIAEKMMAQGKKPLAIAWARQAINKAKVEGRADVAQRANEIIKTVRGSEALKMAAQLGDVDGLVMGRLLGLW